MGENARGPAKPLFPVGGRTALHYGHAAGVPGVTVSMTDLDRIHDYPARDMTITVEAGIRMDKLAAALKKEGQRLAVDVAQSHRATLGGVIATNTSGPRRFGLGTIRDYVIGVTAIDATGRTFKAGGRVVKNVAGYDLCKMLVGSLGTLAVISQVTLKLRPEPAASALLWVSFDHLTAVEQALQGLTGSSARPVAMEVLNSTAAATIARESGLDVPVHRPVLCLGVEGGEAEVQWQLNSLRTELSAHAPHDMANIAGDAAEKLWVALTEFAVPLEDPATIQANLKPSRVIEFVGQCERSGISVQARAGNGILDCDDRWKSALRVFGAPEPSWQLMRKLKTTLDPRNLLNPHRMEGLL
jgi:glycolate oxidase FAD binding subunit